MPEPCTTREPAQRGCVRMSVTLPADLARDFAVWCRWVGTTPGAVVAAHLEAITRGFEVRQGDPEGPADCRGDFEQ